LLELHKRRGQLVGFSSPRITSNFAECGVKFLLVEGSVEDSYKVLKRLRDDESCCSLVEGSAFYLL